MFRSPTRIARPTLFSGENDSHALHGLGLAKLAEGKKEDALSFLKLAYQHEERPDKKILIRGDLIRMGAIPH